MTNRQLAHWALIATFLVMPGTSHAFGAKDPVVIEATTKWNLDYAENKCRLMRTFGVGADRHLLFFEQSGPSSSFGMTVAGPAFSRFDDIRTTAVRLGADGDPQMTRPFIGDAEPVGAALIYSSFSIEKPVEEKSAAIAASGPVELAHIDIARGAQIDQISFAQGSRVVALRTGKLDAPMAALNACAQDLIRHWGLDLDKHRSATRLPVWTNMDRIANRVSKAYPVKARNKGEQGIFRLRVIVDETGAVVKCEVDNATATEALESPACSEMRNATFEPALDAEGKPMRSFYGTSIVYIME